MLLLKIDIRPFGLIVGTYFVNVSSPDVRKTYNETKTNRSLRKWDSLLLKTLQRDWRGRESSSPHWQPLKYDAVQNSNRRRNVTSHHRMETFFLPFESMFPALLPGKSTTWILLGFRSFKAWSERWSFYPERIGLEYTKSSLLTNNLRKLYHRFSIHHISIFLMLSGWCWIIHDSRDTCQWKV